MFIYFYFQFFYKHFHGYTKWHCFFSFRYVCVFEWPAVWVLPQCGCYRILWNSWTLFSKRYDSYSIIIDYILFLRSLTSNICFVLLLRTVFVLSVVFCPDRQQSQEADVPHWADGSKYFHVLPTACCLCCQGKFTVLSVQMDRVCCCFSAGRPVQTAVTEVLNNVISTTVLVSSWDINSACLEEMHVCELCVQIVSVPSSFFLCGRP